MNINKLKHAMTNAIEKEWFPSVVVLFIAALLVGCLSLTSFYYS
jgi:hypothetical protein